MKGRTRNTNISKITILIVSTFVLISLFTPISTMAEGNESDSDGDGVSDLDDRCKGFDDFIDVDLDGVPDGCDNWHPRPRHTDALVKPTVLSVIFAFTYLILLRRLLY